MRTAEQQAARPTKWPARCPETNHSKAANASASQRGVMLAGTARWCGVHRRWECRYHAQAHVLGRKVRWR